MNIPEMPKELADRLFTEGICTGEYFGGRCIYLPPKKVTEKQEEEKK